MSGIQIVSACLVLVNTAMVVSNFLLMRKLWRLIKAAETRREP